METASVDIVGLLNVLCALILGLAIGYERSFHGRAAGMRTYGLVSMGAAALTVVAAHPEHWFGPHLDLSQNGDATRIIQGIVTGIGFLGAGVIVKDELKISGLTTAASLWTCSAIGILVGLGYYATSLLLTVLSTLTMMYGLKLEDALPSRPALMFTITFRHGFLPDVDGLRRAAFARGYRILDESVQVILKDGRTQMQFVAYAIERARGMPVAEMSRELTQMEGVDGFKIMHSRT